VKDPGDCEPVMLKEGDESSLTNLSEPFANFGF
jgi:hypothetical protein